ncbi:MAG TPA: HlyD family secretion protein [Bryobacteraceae bacterium]|nr:HlyD family secretion protein [Bryobacteraceae bacterium]
MATLQREEQRDNADDMDTPEDNDRNGEQIGGRSRSRRVRMVVFAILILAIIAAIPIYNYYDSRESTDDAQIDGHIVPISSRINGTILSVLVNDNQLVTAGAELVKLDPANYQAQLAQAEANVASAEADADAAKVNVPIIEINTSSQIKTTGADVLVARAGVDAAQKQVDAANARLASAKAQLAQAEANNNRAQKDVVRYKELVDKDEISQSQYDAYFASAQASAAQVDTAKAGVNEAAHNVAVAQAAIAQAKAKLNSANVTERQSRSSAPQERATSKAKYEAAQAQLKQAQASLELAKLNVDYTILRSPVTGLVSKKNAEPGMRVSPGQQVMAVIPLDDVWITANFKETQLTRMKVGQEVEIKVDAYGGRKYKGHIDSIAAASGARFSLLPPENATGNYVKVVQRVPVKIVLDPGQNQDHLLRPGLSVEPTVLLNSK